MIGQDDNPLASEIHQVYRLGAKLKVAYAANRDFAVTAYGGKLENLGQSDCSKYHLSNVANSTNGRVQVLARLGDSFD